MSRGSWLLALCAATGPTSLCGQDTLVAQLRVRADSLLQNWRQAQGIADLADSLERERAAAGRETIAVGALRIISNPSPLPLREAAARAWPVIDSLYGTAAADLAHWPYLIRAVDPDPAMRRRVLHVGLELPWDLDVEAATRVLLMNVPVAPPDAALGEWLGAALRPSLRPEDDRRAVYLQLITAPSQTVRDCFLGDIARCKDALQLGDTSHLLERWYPSSAERHALVRESFAEFFNRGATTETFRTCSAGNDAACTQLLRSLPPGALPKPLAQAARAALVREALRLGGRDAYRRLLAEPRAPIADRIAAAAGVAGDSVVAGWRRSMLTGRPPPVTLPWWAFFTACAWMAFFAVCGLRSSRWRL
jgi:hypothetical protein